jgi:hypothetical protein
MIGGVVLLLGAVAAALVVMRGRAGSEDEKAWVAPPGGLPPMQGLEPAVALPPGLAMPPASNVAMPPGLVMPTPTPAPAPAPVVDPAAQSYYDGLLAQGYDPASALMYTQQYYPAFQA